MSSRGAIVSTLNVIIRTVSAIIRTLSAVMSTRGAIVRTLMAYEPSHARSVARWSGRFCDSIQVPFLLHVVCCVACCMLYFPRGMVHILCCISLLRVASPLLAPVG
jgi:hypothetical protein